MSELGAVLIPHGMQKLFGAFGGPGMTGFIGSLQKAGYSPAMASILGWIIPLLEFGGGVLLIIGLFTRPIALAVLIFKRPASITAAAASSGLAAAMNIR